MLINSANDNCYPKKSLLKTFMKPVTGGNVFLLVFFIAKICLPIFAHFGKQKKIFQLRLIQIFFLAIVLFMYKEGFWKFSNTNIYLLGPCNFLKKQTFPRVQLGHAAKFPNFWELSS